MITFGKIVPLKYIASYKEASMIFAIVAILICSIQCNLKLGLSGELFKTSKTPKNRSL